MRVHIYYRKVFRYLRPYWPVAVASVVSTLLVVGVGLLAPWPMKILVDSVLGNEPLPQVLNSAGALTTDKFTMLVIVVAAGLGVALASGLLNVLMVYLHT